MLARRLVAGLGTLLAAGCSPVTVLNALAARDGVSLTTDLAYAAGERHGVDVYAPPDALGAPTVVFFYGGSWDSGDRGMYRFLGASLASAGVVCIVPDYRVYPEVRFPDFMHDAARAVAWSRDHAAAHGGAPDRLFLMGHSAGAQMATLLALDPEYLEAEGLEPKAALRGVVGLSGPYDFLPLRSRTLRAIFGAESQWPASQPINFAGPGAPPMLLATGAEDSIVLPRNTERLAARLRASGNAVRTATYAGIGHQEIMGAFAPALRFLAPVRDDVLRFVTGGERVIILPAIVILSAVMATAWWVQRRLRNAGWVDVFWTFGLGGTGVLVALAAGDGPRRFIVAALVGAWALRLGLHIAERSRGGHEDSRYAHFRNEWGADFERRMFVFLQIQAAAAGVLLVPVLLAAASPRPLGWLDALGVAIAAIAFLGEAVADRQLQSFRRDPANRSKVCDSGLWGVSRHPNYVFEWLHWWAYPVLAIGAPWAVLSLIGPAFMFWLLVHVSGIPPLEAQMLRSRGDAYRAYQRRVSAFLPIPKGWTS